MKNPGNTALNALPKAAMGSPLYLSLFLSFSQDAHENWVLAAGCQGSQSITLK